MEGLSFSPQEVTALTAIFAALLTPLGTLFWLLQKSKNDTIDRLDRALSKSEDTIDIVLPALKEQVTGFNVAIGLIAKEQEAQRAILESIREAQRQIVEEIRRGGQNR